MIDVPQNLKDEFPSSHGYAYWLGWQDRANDRNRFTTTILDKVIRLFRGFPKDVPSPWLSMNEDGDLWLNWTDKAAASIDCNDDICGYCYRVNEKYVGGKYDWKIGDTMPEDLYVVLRVRDIEPELKQNASANRPN